ncbi:hypothetical protein [Bermanella sp. R86510]|uniref:hypothetical protein n=1 Tax=unclassified Bermanella TaxID=2627862 RepID=UPI0037C568E8
MELIDFKHLPILNTLRENMGAHKDGTFELFDPEKHASWQEKEQLKEAIKTVAGQFVRDRDQKLFYKNVPVIALLESRIHFAYCDLLKQLSSKGRLNNLEITQTYKLLHNPTTCEYCLHTIGFKGFDVYRHRHQDYNEKILKQFSLQQYLSSYF